MIRIRILLQGGHVYETQCAADAPLLADMFKAAAGTDGLTQLRIEQNGNVRGLAIPCSQIVAIETDPQFIFQPTAQPTIRPASYIRIPEFLSQAENAAVMEYAVGKQPAFGASSVEGGAKG